LANPATSLVVSMRHRVTIQSKSSVSDGQGGATETWVNGATVWASITDLSGFEKFQAMQMQSPNTHKLVMRYRDDVTTASRIVFQTRVFWVKEILNPEQRSRFMIIKAIERA
jgi:SPP1 family predicted phage head-tail adaptor